MPNRVGGRHHAPVVAKRLAGVRVDVEARIVAAGNIQTNAVALFEDIRRGV